MFMYCFHLNSSMHAQERKTMSNSKDTTISRNIKKNSIMKTFQYIATHKFQHGIEIHEFLQKECRPTNRLQPNALTAITLPCLPPIF